MATKLWGALPILFEHSGMKPGLDSRGIAIVRACGFELANGDGQCSPGEPSEGLSDPAGQSGPLQAHRSNLREG